MIGVIDNKQIRVAFYLRVSTEDQVEKYGLEAQRTALEGFIKSKGKIEDGRDKIVFAGDRYVYSDDGISGTTSMDERPAFARLKEDILYAPPDNKPFDAVAVFKIDRFARKLHVLVDIIKFFEEYKITFTSANESIDTSTPFGRAMLGIMGVIAELELENIHERTQKGREAAVKAGVYMGANAPYGYTKNPEGKLIVLPEESEHVKEIFRLFTVQNLSIQRIADLLKERELISPEISALKYNKRKGSSKKKNDITFWRYDRIRDILSNEVYTGVYYYGKSHKQKELPRDQWKLSPYRHASIIYSHIFEVAQKKLEDVIQRKTLNKKKEDNTIYVLSGLLKCDHCRTLLNPPQEVMTTWTGDRKQLKDKDKLRYSYYYQCNRKNRSKFSVTCPVVPIPATELEEYVIRFIKRLLEDPQATFDYQKNLNSRKLTINQHIKDKAHFEKLLNALPARKKNLSEQQEKGYIDINTLASKFKKMDVDEVNYKKKIEELDFKLSEIELSEGYITSLEHYKEKYKHTLEESFNDKKEVYEMIHDLVYQIIVYSRPRSETDAIAGRKKDNQYIPYKVDIHLNLPQDILRKMHLDKFGARKDNL